MKIWKGNENSDDKIIAVDSTIIYKANPDNFEIDHYVSDFKKGMAPQKNVTGIPFNYISEIIQQEGKNYIQLVMAKDSEEHLRIADDTMRAEIFKYFKETIPGAVLSTENYSKLKAGKKPLIGAAVVLGLFLWTLPYALDYDKGLQYEIQNEHYNNLTGIVLAIASLGSKKTILIFGSLLIVAFTSFYLKAKKPPVIHRIKWK